MDKPKLSKVPLPTDSETLEQFEKTELNDPAYKGLTVQDILKGDVFTGNDGVEYDISNIRKSEKLMAFLKQEKPKSDEVEKSDEAKTEEKEEKVEKEKVDAMPSTEAPELKVVEDPNIAEELPADESEAKEQSPSANIPSEFTPEYRINEEKLASPVEFSNVNGFMHLEKDGLGTMRNATSVPKTHRKYAQIEKFMQQLNPAAIVSDDIEGDDDYVASAIHSFKPEAAMHVRSAVTEQELSTVTANEANKLGDIATINPQFIEDTLTSDRDQEEPVFAASSEPLGTIVNPTFDGDEESTTDVRVARYMGNPYRIALLQKAQGSAKFMKVTQDQLLDERRGLPLNAYMRVLLRSRQLSEMDIFNDKEITKHVFDRAFLDDPKGMHKYLRDKTFDKPELAQSQMKRSLNIAASHASVLTTNANRVVPHGSTRNVPEATLAAIQRIMPGHASEYFQKLCAHLLGGLNQELTMDFTDVHEAEQDSLIPLASAANLLLLDKRFLGRTEIYTLVLGLIKPFYPSYTDSTKKDKISAHDLALALTDDTPYNTKLPAIDDGRLGRANIRVKNGGQMIRNAIQNILNVFFGNANEFTSQESKAMVYDLDQPPTYFPIPPAHKEMFKIIAFGEGSGHDTTQYADFIDRRIDVLKNFAQVMEFKSMTGNIYEKISAAIDPATHIYHGCGAIVDMMTKAMASSTDLMPAQFQANTELRRLHAMEPTKLPFLGALSFFFYGVSSSALPMNEISGDFLPFVLMKEFPLLSKYPLYRFYEHAMTRFVYRHLDQREGLNLRSENINLLVDIVDDCMRVFYKSTESDSKNRIKYMLQHASRYLIDIEDPPELPEAMKRVALATNMIESKNSMSEQPEQGILFGQSFAKDGVIMNPETSTYNIFDRSRMTLDRVINSFIISVHEGIDPVMFYTNEYARIMTYLSATMPLQDVMDLEDLIDSTENLQNLDSVNLETIQHLAKKHPQRPNYIRVKVHDCPIKLIQQEGFTDTIAESLTIKISLKKEFYKRKYSMEYFPVYYKLNNDKRSVDVNGNELLGMENKTFDVPYFITVAEFQKTLIHHSMMRLNRPKAYANNFRIRDGSGMIYVTPMDVAVRKSEKLVTLDKLVFR